MEDILSKLKIQAQELGFSALGVSRVHTVEDDVAAWFRQWIDNEFHGEMHYMAEHSDKRLNPALLTPFQPASIIVMAMSYFYSDDQDVLNNSKYKISRYAFGKNYHLVMRKKLENFCRFFIEQTGGQIKAYNDTSPVLEKYWAQKAGLGGIGKNTCLIVPGYGSWVFLAVCLTDVALEPDHPFEKNLCGSCTKCIDACPTGAIVGAGKLDASKCIACLTVEHQSEFDDATLQWNDWIWGCDVCQEVCPHNRSVTESVVNEFKLLPKIVNLMNGSFNPMTYDTEYAGTSVKRRGLERIPRNKKWVDQK